MIPLSENGIFWNVYEQECGFRGVTVKPPRVVRTTCDKLAALYPDLDEAERFIRAQFVMPIHDIGYHLPERVFAFKDFIMDRHAEVYEDYKRSHVHLARDLIDMAMREAKAAKPPRRIKLPPPFKFYTPLPQSGLGQYLFYGKESSPEVQDSVVIECLHWRLLEYVLPLTSYVSERIQFYRDEVRGIEKPSRRYSGNSRYLIDLSDI